MGQLLGAFLGVYVLYAIWEFALFQRILDDPVKGKVLSVLAAYLTSGTFYGFFEANGSPFVMTGYVLDLLPALVIGAFAYRRGKALREQIDPEVGETFG